MWNKITYETTQRVLQSTASGIADTGLQLIDILLFAGRDFVDVAFGQVACFVLAHGVKSLFLHLALEPGRDAEPGDMLACRS